MSHSPITALQTRSRNDLRPDQWDAIAACQDSWVLNHSIQYLSACGTGKTTTMFELAKERKAKLVVFFVPSIALVRQTIEAWTMQSGMAGIHAIPVCSDSTVGKPRQRDNTDDPSHHLVAEVGVPVFSNAKDIAAQITARPGNDNKMTVVFCTYDSAHHVVDAQHKNGAPVFDIAFMDEAHHLVGDGSGPVVGELVKAKNDSYVHRLLARRRLYATATPKTATQAIKNAIAANQKLAVSAKTFPDYMDNDSNVYGPYAYTMSFGQAISRDILVDYSVSVIAVTEAEYVKSLKSNPYMRDVNDRTVPAQYILTGEAIRLARAGGARRFITYQNRVDASSDLNDFLNSNKHLPPSAHVNGKMTGAVRDSVVHHLGSASVNDTGMVVTNVRCLNEGVDIPALDVVVFVDPKHSAADVMQSIGRVLRKDVNGTKTHGQVILIVVVPDALNADDMTDDEYDRMVSKSPAFAPVFKVLAALEQHDEVVASYMSELRVTGKAPLGGLVRTTSTDYDSAPLPRRSLTASEASKQRGDVFTITNSDGETTLTTERLMKNIRLIAARKPSHKSKTNWEPEEWRDDWIKGFMSRDLSRTYVEAANHYDVSVERQVSIERLAVNRGITRTEARAIFDDLRTADQAA